MLLTEKVFVKWNSKIKKHYVDKGYNFTKMKDLFEANVFDLTNGSAIKVSVRCDYCDNIFQIGWREYYMHSQGIVKKDCCGNSKCTGEKAQEAIFKKYNGKIDNLKLHIAEKRKSTNLKKYGVENVFSSPIIKDKIKHSLLKKYGVDHPLKNEEIKDKVKNTCLKKYGVPYFLLLEWTGDNIRGEKSPKWKGGVKYHRVERSTDEYLQWRKQVFERDHFLCRKCKKHTTLNSHHIFNWKDNPDRRYDVDNGISLCKRCHIQFHSIYGKKLNNDIQINEFLNYGEKIC